MQEEIYTFSQYVKPELPLNIRVAGVSYCDNTYSIKRSNYDYFVIEYTFGGEGVLEVDGQQYNIGTNDTYFLYKGKGHRYYCKENSWKKIWVVFSGELVETLFNVYLKECPNVLRQFAIYGSLQKIIDLARDPNISYEEMVNQSAIILHKILVSAGNLDVAKADSLPIAVKNYIDDNLNNPLDLKELSEVFHFSPNYIIALFRMHFGCTPYVYYEKQRMHTAKELLINTSLSVGDIAGRLGFDNQNYFSKCFKKEFDIAPSHFRKKISLLEYNTP